MAQSADALCKIYSSANKHFVIAGCILHDIGKLQELATDQLGNASYTLDGNMFGHSIKRRCGISQQIYGHY